MNVNIVNSTMPASQQQLQWFAMRVTFRREMAVKMAIDDTETEGVETFIPMKQVVRRTRRGVKMKLREPAVHNLLFVKAAREWLQAFKAKLPHLQYLTTRRDGRSVPITVPETDMKRFIAVSNNDVDNALYFTPGEVDLSRGTRVRLHGGPLDGIEATYVKLAGKRNKRIVVEIDNVISIATATVSPDLIEVLD